MPTFTYTPSYSASQNTKPRVNEARFGDGYTQRVGDGINRQPRKFDLSFKNRTKTEADSIEAFLIDRDAQYSFDWTPPFGAAGLWLCREWTRVLDDGNWHTITCSFEEVFE